MKNIKLIALALLAFINISMADQPSLKTDGGQIEIITDRFKLRLASDGTPSSCKLTENGQELLVSQNKGDGFVVVTIDNREIPLKKISVSNDGKYLIAMSDTESQSIHFRVHASSRHIAFCPERMQGFSKQPGLSLRFRVNLNNIGIIGHNYMVRDDKRGNQLIAQWLDLNGIYKGDNPGGFSIYHYANPKDEDDALIDIWTQEDVPHPAVKGDWTPEKARSWLKQWQADRDGYTGRMFIEALNYADMVKASDIAKTAGLSEIYQMPWIWRGEYWPIKNTNCGINTNIYPNGEADFKKYCDFLSSRQQTTALHWVSGGIGLSDPIYIAQKPDRRLASWGSGTLLEAINEKTGDINFKPADDCSPPYILPDVVATDIYKPALGRWQSFSIMRIEDEIIRFHAILDTDKNVWTFNHVRRGQGTTLPSAHPAGAECVGLIAGYGQNVLPDNWSTLLEEMAETKASLLNRNNIPHIEFDGFEIHRYYGMDANKFAEFIYKKLDHPTSAYTSSGHAPKAWIEYRFNCIDERNPERAGFVPLRVNLISRPATSLLMAHYGATMSARAGLPHFRCGTGDRGFTIEDFNTHGLANEVMKSMNTWRTIILNMTDSQHSQMGTINKGGHSPVVFVPEKTTGGYNLYPTQIMPTGRQTAGWFHAGENGPIEPWRYVKTGETHNYENMFEAQEPQFTIQVLATFNYEATDNISLQPSVKDIGNLGDTKVSETDDGLVFSMRNGRNHDFKIDTGYPTVNLRKPYDLSNHRGIGFFIESDGQDEIFNIEYQRRDFMTHTDFKGQRYIEIPNGEVSYTYGTYGWRYDVSKDCNYARIGQFGIGFKKVPAGKTVSVKISGLKALNEIQAPLVNPTIKTDSGTLAIKGEIPWEHYIEYRGANTVSVYDANWNKTTELPIEKNNFTISKGPSNISVETDSKTQPWLAVEFMTRGTPIGIKTP